MKKQVLLYHFQEQDITAIKLNLMPVKYSVKEIKISEYNQPVGALAGLKNMELSAEEYGGEDIEREFILICGAEQHDFNRLLAALKKNPVSAKAVKAVLTETNQTWTSIELIKEVFAEHEFMTKR